ncbi:flagellar basal-body rod protein FlgF [Roseococcus sp. YIM B11640]|uniref:flagellar basal-body rod protein FlgF n=1 Tax=Roseococcus sp. YIM B11640 TaxID=3133973 RepID=UPI003C7E14A4
MDSPGYIILSRLSAQMRASSVAANNLANAETPGFRASRPVFSELVTRQNGVGAQGRNAAYSWDRATWRDLTPGPITTTGNPLDVAIQGSGYFAIETPGGERYTRAGRFTISAEGRLVDQQGNAVLNVNSQPIAIAAGDARIEIRGDGTIRSENGVIGQLRIVRFEDEQDLRAEGDRLFDAGGQEAEAVARPSLVQGAVEGSNVRSVTEMTRMMAELREFQIASQFLDHEGERQQSAIDRLLRRRS